MLAAAALCAGMVQAQPTRETNAKALAQASPAALNVVAERTGAPTASLRVVASAVARYAQLQQQVYAFKVQDAKGAVHGVALDGQGRTVQPAELAKAEQTLRRQRYGALDDALMARMKDSGAEPIDVFVWLVDSAPRLASKPAARGKPLKPQAIDAIYTATEKVRKGAVDHIAAPVLERVRQWDKEARSGSPSPYVAARLNVQALQALAQDKAIDTIYLSEPALPELAEAKAAMRIPVVHQAGLTGKGVRVAVINAGGGVIEPFSLLLKPFAQDALNTCGFPYDWHGTSVVGVLLERKINFFGTVLGEEGAAPGVNLRAGGSCSTRSDEMMDASTRAATWGARLFNLSWGISQTMGAMDRFYDDLTINGWRTVFKSAGNRHCLPVGTDGDVTSPGLAYNVITVGGFDDHGTATWDDDTVDGCASFGNPTSTHADREKPEVAAPSVHITAVTARTVNSPPTGPTADFLTDTGTSFAAPLVTATAAMLVERNSRLALWPEITKAVLMASAIHNIEGSSRLSDVDGAGGVVASAAADLVQDTSLWGGRRYTCDNSTPSNIDLMSFSAGPRTRQRVVIAWDSDPAGRGYTSAPTADIDLRVVDSNGRTVASSMSFDNTFEMVEFDVTRADTYTVRASKFRCDMDTWLGWARYTLPRPAP